MAKEVQNMMWRASASFIGAALPLVLLGRTVMTAVLAAGIVTGLMATKGESLRATMRLMLNSWLVLGIIVFMGVMLASVAFGIAPAEGFDKWLQVAGMIVAAGLLYMSLREMPGAQVEVLMKSLAITTYAMAALATIDALAGYERLSVALHDVDKAASPYRLNFMSAVLAVLLPLVWSRILLKAQEREPFAMRILGPAIGFGVFALLVCGGRAGWVAAFVSFSLFALLLTRWHGVIFHARQWFGGVVWLLAAAGAYALAHGTEFATERFLVVTEAARGPLSGRVDVWAQVVGWISNLQNPLLGIGPMAYRTVPGALDAHPHNWVLQMILETGWLGFAAYSALLGIVGWTFLKYARRGIYGVGALASFTAFVVAGLANTSAFNAWWLAFLLVGTLIGWRVGWAPEDKRRRRGGKKNVLRTRDVLRGGHGARTGG